MGCVFAVIGAITPRLLMALILIFTGWFGRAYQTFYWPLLGFFFMPYTTLAYMAAMLKNDHSLSGGWLALFIVAVIVDCGHWGHGGATCRRRRSDWD